MNRSVKLIEKMSGARPARWAGALLLLFLGGALAGMNIVWADGAEKPGYRDIYLTGDRVCKACTWDWENKTQVRLTNRRGEATLVRPGEIIGIDKHPIMRRLTLHSLHHIGIAGPVIVPAAFKDGNDYVCKYCDTMDPE